MIMVLFIFLLLLPLLINRELFNYKLQVHVTVHH